MSIDFRIKLRAALLGASFLLIAACGNKGPLVLPQQPVPVEAVPVDVPEGETPPAQTTPADESQPIDGAQRPIDDGIDDGTP